MLISFWFEKASVGILQADGVGKIILVGTALHDGNGCNVWYE